MKDFLTLAKERFSVRKYQYKAIEPEKMEKILEAAKVAPTAANLQPVRIYVLQSEDALKKIRELTPCAFNAPVVLMITYSESEQWKNKLEEGIASGQEDASIVATHIMMEAWDLGIGSCWVNAFPNSKAAEAFDVPADEKVVLLMPLGYADKTAEPSPMHEKYRPASEVVKVL
ncbi:MAG: nitroreductase family protein [Eubacterium sp.]|jgi:nitroreductase